MRRRGKRRLARFAAESLGQSTVEYAIILGAFLAMVMALGAIARAVSEGVVVGKAVEAASHSAGESFVGSLQDVALY